MALSKSFFDTLPKLKTVAASKADIAWFVYDLILNPGTKRYELCKVDTVYTSFEDALRQISTTKAGPMHEFMTQLQSRLDQKLESAPITQTIEPPF